MEAGIFKISIFAWMKWLFAIWTLYMLALSVVPCSDAVSVTESHKHASAEGAHGHTQEKERAHADSCSPFCYCACCGVPTAFQQYQMPEICAQHVPVVSRRVAMRKSIFKSSYFGSIWQPPKINV